MTQLTERERKTSSLKNLLGILSIVNVVDESCQKWRDKTTNFTLDPNICCFLKPIRLSSLSTMISYVILQQMCVQWLQKSVDLEMPRQIVL